MAYGGPVAAHEQRDDGDGERHLRRGRGEVERPHLLGVPRVRAQEGHADGAREDVPAHDGEVPRHHGQQEGLPRTAQQARGEERLDGRGREEEQAVAPPLPEVPQGGPHVDGGGGPGEDGRRAERRHLRRARGLRFSRLPGRG